MTHLVPLREQFLAPFEETFNKFYDEFFGSGLQLRNGVRSRSAYPKIDVLREDGRYKVEAAIPGVNPKDLEIEVIPEVDNGTTGSARMVRIAGKMSEDRQYEQVDYQVRELRRSRFERVISLPNDVVGDPEAVVKDGILSLTWRVDTPPPTRKMISVKVE